MNDQLLFEKVQEELTRDPSLAHDINLVAEVRMEAEAISELRQAIALSEDQPPVCFTFA